MKTYLMGDFLTGLKTAGLTDAMLWAPTRKVANKGQGSDGTHDITDTLWLLTVWEMFGSNEGFSSTTYETSANQARLEYYTDANHRIKHDSTGTRCYWWLASPSAAVDSYFCSVYANGHAAYTAMSNVESGCAPAFCVK